MKIDTKLAKAFRNLRRIKDLTAKQVADDMSTSHTTVKSIENREARITEALADKVHVVFKKYTSVDADTVDSLIEEHNDILKGVVKTGVFTNSKMQKEVINLIRDELNMHNLTDEQCVQLKLAIVKSIYRL